MVGELLGAEGSQDALEIRGEGRDEGERLLGDRVDEFESVGVEGLSFEEDFFIFGGEGEAANLFA